jgi:hypothetical protein
MPLNIAFWNIQSFGTTRTGNTEVMTEVCRQISLLNADLLCIQELVVSNYTDASNIVAAINNGITVANYEFILCPHNGFEMYLFLYRPTPVGGGTLRAVALAAGGRDQVDDTSLLTETFAITNLSTANGMNGLTRYFPLFNYPTIGNAARPPGIGLFQYTDGLGGVHNTAVFQWHNDASGTNFIAGNIRRLAQSTCIANRTFIADVAGTPTTFNNILVGGDFNNDLQNNPFANYVRQINANTHLHTFDINNDIGYTSTLHIRDACYDNILTSLANMTTANNGVFDIANYYWQNRNGLTGILLTNSNLLNRVNVVDQIEKRLLVKFSTNSLKKSPNKIAKTGKTKIRNLMLGINLLTVRTTRLTTLIQNERLSVRDTAVAIRVCNSYLQNELATTLRWNLRLQNMNGLIWNDVLCLTRYWLSDHLPVIITLNP